MWLRIILLVIIAEQAYGQASAGRVSGVVSDSSGAVIPGAKITASNVETGIDQSVPSNAEGSYVLYPLPPGTYNVTAQAKGFRSERLERIQVDVAAILSYDFRLKVGEMSQQLDVSAESVPMLTQSASVESTVT